MKTGCAQASREALNGRHTAGRTRSCSSCGERTTAGWLDLFYCSRCWFTGISSVRYQFASVRACLKAFPLHLCEENACTKCRRYSGDKPNSSIWHYDCGYVEICLVRVRYRVEGVCDGGELCNQLLGSGSICNNMRFEISKLIKHFSSPVSLSVLTPVPGICVAIICAAARSSYESPIDKTVCGYRPRSLRKLVTTCAKQAAFQHRGFSG
jgi:hypothetical protein